MMKFRKNILLKTYKRYINTKVLREALIDMTASSISNRTTSLKQDIFRLETLEVKAETTVNNNIIHEDILTNILESEKILENLRKDLDLIKKTQLNLNIKVENADILQKENIINNLNDKVGYYQAEETHVISSTNMDSRLLNRLNNTDIIISNTNKSIWDVSWLQPFFDFMHNHSTLVFTVGGGMLLGGMLYLNSFGIINIGSLVTRLGLNLFGTSTSTVSQPINSNPININIQNPENNVRQISSGFFKELGKKLLEVIDLYIEKLKDGRIKYK